jgi:hypothetical protein
MAKPFKVIRIGAAVQQIKQIHSDFSTPTERKAFLDRLTTIAESLQSNPLEYGDPVHKTQKPGGMVYRKYSTPYLFSYALYEEDRAVAIFDFRRID